MKPATRVATLRAVLLQSWRGAQARIEQYGATQLTLEEEAGRLLAKWDNAVVAHVFATSDPVRELLAAVAKDEGGVVDPAPGRNAS